MRLFLDAVMRFPMIGVFVIIFLALSVLIFNRSSDRQRPCPESDARLSLVEVADGPRSDLAFLMPEDNDDEGRFDLGYIYDQGRYVSIRCVYQNGSSKDVELRQRISECRYRIENGAIRNFECK